MMLEHTAVYNMFEALHGARLSYGSKSDTLEFCKGYVPQKTLIGRNDEELIRKLVKAGPSHRKFMRQILVSVDITAPRYWWTQFDTYKVGVTACSESTMHTLMKRELEQSDFARELPDGWLERLNGLIKQKKFECLVNALPQGYMQKRHVTLNYEAALNIKGQRNGHKLEEWQLFIQWIDSLPHADIFFDAPPGKYDNADNDAMHGEYNA